MTFQNSIYASFVHNQIVTPYFFKNKHTNYISDYNRKSFFIIVSVRKH